MKITYKLVKVTVLILLILIAILNIYVYIEGKKYIVSSVETTPDAQVAIILGAGIKITGIPGAVLEDRILTAISLYQEKKVSKILVSGSNVSVSDNEVDPVRRTLIAAGIPIQDIFLDHGGLDTYSSMYRAKAVFGVSSAIIVTQEFHLPRAVYTARSLGIDAYGVSADRGQYSIYNYLRELLARPNAFIEVLFHRIPKYLGPIIPISGDGSVT